jgi:hypothetical protein
MSEEPTAPEEEEVVTKTFVADAVRFGRDILQRQLDEDLDRKIDSAIRALKNDLERERLERERAESTKRWDQSMEWTKRFGAGVIGAVAMMFVMIFAEQCSELHQRVNTLESKQTK